jgi:hypothetical protein
MDGGWSHQADAAVAVFMVVPVEEPLAVSAGVFDRTEAIGEVGSVFQSFGCPREKVGKSRGLMSI